ncbi:MAG: hypothetical protein K6B28_06645 [Lachnospiraceae bacterium]|nr:hypothetical protein [Lachnospiraceae bacterium]
MIKLNKKNIIGTIILLSGLISASIYIFIGQRTEFNADFTDTLIWAFASSESGSIVNPEYNYAYFLPFGGSLLMLPIVKVFGVTYFAHTLGMFVFLLIFTVSLLLFCLSMNFEYEYSSSITGTLLILLLATHETRMIFYGHIIHYSLAMLFSCIAFFLFNKINYDFSSHLDKRQKIYYSILLLWLFLSCFNGESILMLFFFPFVGSIILYRMLDLKKAFSLKTDGYQFLLGLGMLLAGGAGYIIKKIFIKYDTNYEKFFANILPYDSWIFKHHPFLTNFVTMFTGNNDQLTPLMSVNGLLILFEYLLAWAVILIPFIALFSYNKFSKPLRIFHLFYLLLFALTFFIYSISYPQVSNWRLGALIGMALLFVMFYSVYLLKSGTLMRFAVVLTAVIIMGEFCDLYKLRSTLPSENNTNEFDGIIDVLNENGLTYGYSTYWNGACAIDILSDSKINVRPIEINEENGTISPYLYNSKASWYEDQQDTDRYFVIIRNDNPLTIKALTDNADNIIEYNDNTKIYLYDRNIFSNLEFVFRGN